jgi:UDP-N-acetyl-alpha-D-muramoyl-L-alanyl-L-glutamate epimerase
MTARSDAQPFAVLPWRLGEDAHSLAFPFHSPRFGAFAETLRFPQAQHSVAEIAVAAPGLVDLLASVLSLSYYKADPVGHLRLPRALPPAANALLEALLRDGLGEFYVRNGLPFPPLITITAAAEGPPLAAAAPRHASPPAKAITAFGGGKDSYVALRLLAALGIAAEPCAVTLSPASDARLAGLSQQPLTRIARRIDPALIAANRAGALNGHIPITAINSLILALFARMRGADWVAFANERAAEEPTLIHEGHPINHQFSKTYQCETLMRAALASVDAAAPTYFSILRPVSEVWIAQRLVQDEAALQHFSSCNRNFVFSGPSVLAPGVRWCGACAKCVFTALITAPFLSRAKSCAVFGLDVLDNPDITDLLADIVGLSAAKPWDCVGATREAAASALAAGDAADWRTARALGAVLPRLQQAWGEDALRTAFSTAMTPSGPHWLPPAVQTLVAP